MYKSGWWEPWYSKNLLPASEVFRGVGAVWRMQKQPLAASAACLFERGARGLGLGRF